MTLSDRDWARLVRIHRVGRSGSSSSTTDDERTRQLARSLLVLVMSEFEITEAEESVAIRLVLGESIALIAQSRKVANCTVKAQLRRVYAAAGVTDHAEFSAAVLMRVLELAAIRIGIRQDC